MPSAAAVPRALVWATDIDKLPPDRVVRRRDGYWAVRTPSNPPFWWGTLLVFDDPPAAGDRTRWEQLFDAEFGDEPRIEHRTFAWDRVDGETGDAQTEFVAAGYYMEDTIGLVAAPDEIRPHPRENRDVTVRALDPAPGRDGDWWAQVVELQVASRDEDNPEPEEVYREFTRRRMDELRMLFREGRGAWYVALAGDGTVAGSCGVVVTGQRGRFHAVDTAASHRRRGICSRLVVEAAHRSAERYGAERLVIAAAADYHALGLYESLGFQRAEHVHGVCQTPAARAASTGSG